MSRCRKLSVTGSELGNPGVIGNSTVPESVHFNPVVTADLTFTFVNTAVFTGYDLQSNGTPQHIWQDPNDPNLVHMVFTKSAEAQGWADRNGTYLFSDDMGQNWQNLGNTQTGTAACRGGFATINGLNDGRPVAALHTNDEITATRTQVYVRDATGSSWVRYNPGATADGEAIWPRVLGVGTDNVVVTASINGAPNNDFFTNTLGVTAGTFSGWHSISGDQAETQNVAKSTDELTVGLAYVGSSVDSLTFGNMYYRESNDGGASWGDEVKIYSYDYAGDSLGAMRGMDICFLGSQPYVVFEIIKQDFSAASYFPAFPNKIMLWSPAINGGTAMVLADSNKIPYFEQYNSSNDVQAPLCRPSIGKAGESGLIITINATTADTMMGAPPSTAANTFYAGWITYSTDAGTTWTNPEKITPPTPRRDWRYLSLNPETQVDPITGLGTILIAAQSDAIAGSTVNTTDPLYPVGVTAELVFISTEAQFIVGVDDNQLVSSYNLEQNYPNPFNPSTSIKFSVPERSDVSLKVYDVLGKEVATLMNETKEAGSYNVTFNSSNLASGMYLYTLKAGSFTSTKKMILMK